MTIQALIILLATSGSSGIKMATISNLSNFLQFSSSSSNTLIWEQSLRRRQRVGESVGRLVAWLGLAGLVGSTNCLNHSTWISVADWQLASDLVLVCDPLEWSLSKLYVLQLQLRLAPPTACLPHRLRLIYVTRLVRCSPLCSRASSGL